MFEENIHDEDIAIESLFGFLFGANVIVDEYGIVTITGIRYRELKRFIQKFYGLGTFLDKFVVRSWTNSIQIHQFYIPEIVYLLTKAVEEKYLSPIITKKVIDLLYEKTWFGNSVKPVNSIVDMNVVKTEFVDNIKLFPYQEEFIKDVYYQKKTQYHLKGYLLSLPIGSGKGLPHGTKIRIPFGWKNIEDIRLGDQVIAVDGTPSTVIGVYPQGKEDIYRVTFVDGRYLDTDEHHLWSIMEPKDCVKNGVRTYGYELTTLNTLQLMARMSNKNLAYKTFIPLVTPEDSLDIPLPIDPYTLGVLLGDGSLMKTGINIHSDLEIINKVQYMNFDHLRMYVTKYSRNNSKYFRDARLRPDLDGSFPIRDGLYQLGLIGKRSWEKFIPDIYLNASFNQRLSLLQGLCDTDGYVADPKKSIGRTGKHSKTGCIEYSTSSPYLAEGVKQLVYSLGGKCDFRSRIPYYTYNGQRLPGRINYRLYIKLKHPDMCFTLQRKRCRLAHESQYSKYWKLRVLSVEKLDYQQECTCIRIDHPSKLFVAKDYIVTHNSLTSLALGTTLHKRHFVIICPLSVVENVWVNEINKFYKNKKTIWTPKQNELLIKNNIEYLIVNYEGIEKVTPYILKSFDPRNTIIIVDECHNFKDYKSKRTQNLYKLCTELKCEDLLLVSGTPIKALGVEVVPILKLLDSYFVPEVEVELSKLTRYTSVMNDLLRNRLGMMMYRKLKEEILTLPEKHEIELRLTIPNGDYYTLDNVKILVQDFTKERTEYYKKHYKEYEKVYYDCLKEFEKTLIDKEDWIKYKEYQKNITIIQKKGFGFENIEYVVAANRYEKDVIIPNLPTHIRAQFRSAKSVIKYVRLKILGEVLGGLLNTLRTEMTTELIGQEVLDIIKDAVKKTILFSSYTDTIMIAEDVCKKAGMRPLVITGDNTKEASRLLEQFKKDDSINPLIASIKAMSTGHTITEANTVIFLNVPFRDVDYQQASDRVYRVSQDTDVYIYKLILDTGDKPNLSTRMQDIIAWSKESFEAIMGDNVDDDTVLSLQLKESTQFIRNFFNKDNIVKTDLKQYQSVMDKIIHKFVSFIKRK